MRMNSSEANINYWLFNATRQLSKAGIGTARLDALILLEDVLKSDRAHLLAHPETHLGQKQLKKLTNQLKRRVKHEPLSYIRGQSEFYGRKFKVNKYVLEPRPESETMIELLKIQRLPMSPRIADVGTGSGNLGITAYLEVPRCQVDLYDIDTKALDIAEKNAKKHKALVRISWSDLLQRQNGAYDVILANLPYVPNRYKLNRAAMMEPAHAIFGGEDGLELYRRLFGQIMNHYQPPKFVLTEALPFQHDSLAALAEAVGYKLQRHSDFIQVFELY